MRGKKFGLICVVAVLNVLMCLNWTLNFKVLANPIEFPKQYPVVCVYPDTVQVEVGETFTISVIVYNLTSATAPDPDNPLSTVPLGDLYGFDLQLSWDPTVIQYQSHIVTVPVENYPNPIPPSPFAGILHNPVLKVMEIIDENGNIPNAADPRVRAWFAWASMLPAAVFNGNGTIVTITFKLISQKISQIEIVDCTIGNIEGFPIARGVNGTWLNPPINGIVPEFGLAPLLTVLLVAAIVLVFIAKGKPLF